MEFRLRPVFERKHSYEIPTVFVCIFSIFDSFHFLNCLMIIVL